MGKFLIVDIGAGTMDVLCYDMESGLHYKAVAKSPVLAIAERAANLPGNLLLTGVEMGGGPISQVLKRRAQEAEVVMSSSAAATVHHDPARLMDWGIKIVEDEEAERLRDRQGYSHLSTGDLDVDRLKHIIEGLGLDFSFDVVGFCAQDHGVAPPGVSHLDYRHNLFKAKMGENPFPHALLFKGDEVPVTLSRLRAIAESAKVLPVDEIYVMDSGMAAILGASMDTLAKQKSRVLVLDVATSHTVGAALEKGEVAGFFEYHTSDITLERLETLLVDLADGNLRHKEILTEGGHGAYTRKGFGFQEVEVIIATGPKRKMVVGSDLPFVFGAPLGDNMMTGTVGVIEAIRRCKGLGPISYL